MHGDFGYPELAVPIETGTEPSEDGAGAALPDWIRVNPERPFISRETDVTHVPVGVWKRLANRVLSEAGAEFFYDPNPAGYHGLRRQVARYLGFARGILCDPDELIITTGTRHSMDLCLRALARSGDAVWTEPPDYFGVDTLVQAHGLTGIPVPVDRDGLRVDLAEAAAPDAKLGLVTPSHQSPLGVRLSVERRTAMLDSASRPGAYIVEDDQDGEFVFDAVRLPAFKAMDTEGRNIHAGSFNKCLFSTLRVGYPVVPCGLPARLRAIRAETGRGNSAIDQHILAHLIANGHCSQHIRRMERVYRAKSALAQRVIREAYGGPLPLLGTHGGFDFFQPLPRTLDLPRFLDVCRSLGLTLQSTAMRAPHAAHQGLVIGYFSLTSGTIARAGTLLSALLRAG